jgi:hypothetical protein
MEFTRRPVNPVYAGQEVALRFELRPSEADGNFEFQVVPTAGGARIPIKGTKGGVLTYFLKRGASFERLVLLPDPGEYSVQYRRKDRVQTNWEDLDTFTVKPPDASPVLKVALQTGVTPASGHEALWDFIKDATTRLTFLEFDSFVQANAGKIDHYMPYGSMTFDSLHELSTDFVTETSLGLIYANTTPGASPAAAAAVATPAARGTTSASSTRGTTATAIPPTEWGPGAISEPAVGLSYVTGRRKEAYHAGSGAGFPLAVPGRYPLDRVPFVELIYVYWLEEAMLFQSLNRILARFQNRRTPGGEDPLSRLAVSPLLPLRGLLWGLVEAEKDRLSLRRRAAEYEYQYGLQLIGRAVPPAELLVERRTRFLEAFHSLLHACYHFYKEDSDTTVNADAFPLLGSLQELHLILSYGANNQFADAALAARIETLDVQWMLAQGEMQEFLGGRAMVPYAEPWMSRIDTMKSMQRWSDASVTHFHDLAVHGEQLLLSIRHGNWNGSGQSAMSSNDAKNWAHAWKASVQRYIHAYRAVTGVDLSERVDTTMPSTLLQRRLARKAVGY